MKSKHFITHNVTVIHNAHPMRNNSKEPTRPNKFPSFVSKGTSSYTMPLTVYKSRASFQTSTPEFFLYFFS